jgi:RNA polymerase sigma factor (sigma-70 family)
VTTAAPARPLDQAGLLALDEVFVAHGARLLHAALRITRDRRDAEDLLQDAFAKACTRPDALEGRSDDEAAGWLWVVMRRAWRDRAEKGAIDADSLDDLDPRDVPADLGPSVHDQAERDWQMAVTYDALSRLGPKHRTAMILLARGLGEVASADAAGVSRRTMREWRRDALGLFGDRLEAGTICTSMQTAVSSVADGEFGAGKHRKTVDAHLAHCRNCKIALGDIQRHSKALQATLPAVTVTATETRAVDTCDLVHIGQQAAEHVGKSRGVVSPHNAWLEYLEDHWRLAVSAGIVVLTAWAVIAQGITNFTSRPAQQAAYVAEVPLASGPKTAARPETPKRARAPKEPVLARMPKIPTEAFARVARIAAVPRPVPVRQAPAAVRVVLTPTPAPRSVVPECTTPECLFGP